MLYNTCMIYKRTYVFLGQVLKLVNFFAFICQILDLT